MTTTYVATLGGAADPVFLPLASIPSLKEAIFLASRESAESASGKLTNLKKECDVRLILTTDPNDLATTYRSFRHVLLELSELTEEPGSILCNITGGTKPMSAALMMLATEFQLPMTYVGGSQRDKDGVGTVVPGHEQELPQQNPWEVLGLTEIRRIKHLWDSVNFTAASNLLATTGHRLRSPLWQTFGDFAEALAARLRFDFTTANKTLKKVRRELPKTHPLQRELGSLRKTCDTLAKSTSPGKGDPGLLLRELTASSDLASSQHRYEDAAARLYRALELWAQIHLFELTDGSYWQGRLRRHRNDDGTPGDHFPVPTALLEPAFLATIRCRDPYPLNIGLSDLFLALDTLQFRPAQTIAADILRGRNKSSFHRMSSKRNESILAHGTVAVTSEKFAAMKSTLSRLLPEFPLINHREILPPPFEESWLSSPQSS